MVLVIGEVLIDEFPGYSRVGGAAFNFAVHMHRFGLPVRFVSRLGRDENGKKILDFITAAGLSTGDIQSDPIRPTGTVRVTLDARGVPEFLILPDTAYDMIETTEAETLVRQGGVTMVYYGTLIQRTRRAFRCIRELLTHRPPSTRSFCDINLRPGCYTDEVVRSSVELADILKLSAEEADMIAASGKMPESLAGSNKTVLLTRGGEGSDWFSAGLHRTIRPKALQSVADTVGAGDAFSAAAALGILRGADPDTVLYGASVFAAAVCGIKGAIPENLDIYDEVRGIYG